MASIFDAQALASDLARNRLHRRQLLWLMSAAGVGWLGGCANSPVGGGSILVGMSEEEEKQVDAKVAPRQFSQDLGAIQDSAVNNYVAEVGARLDGKTHRPQMPYSYRVLNANYVNAYTFPGGAVGVTRGILVDLEDEAELAALLGHELGHVNARHAAQRQGQAMVAQVAVTGIDIAASAAGWGSLAGMGSQLGASALLSSYSRDNEREADALGQEYMVRAGYPAKGMVDLQDLLVRQEKSAPSALQTMFATHPMSRERRETAARLASERYGMSQSSPDGRERFMDHTASLRRIKPTIAACQNGETALAAKRYAPAEEQFRAALKLTPRDYAANLRLAECLQAQDKDREALGYAETARKIYPQEAQAHKLAGVLALGLREPGAAYNALEQYDRVLPGDGGVSFLKGVAQEGMGNQGAAAQLYGKYLQQTRQGKAADYAQSRLRAWGYLR